MKTQEILNDKNTIAEKKQSIVNQISSNNKKLSIVSQYLQKVKKDKISFDEFVKQKNAKEVFNYEHFNFCGVCGFAVDGAENKKCEEQSMYVYFDELAKRYNNLTKEYDKLDSEMIHHLQADGVSAEKQIVDIGLRNKQKENKNKEIKLILDNGAVKLKENTYIKILETHNDKLPIIKQKIQELKKGNITEVDFLGGIADKSYFYAIGDGLKDAIKDSVDLGNTIKGSLNVKDALNIKDSTDDIYRVNNVLIPRLKDLDSKIDAQTKTLEILDANADNLANDGTKIIPITPNTTSAWYLKNGAKAIALLNSWLPQTKKWSADVEKQVYDAMWQVWIKDISVIGLDKTITPDFKSFTEYLGQSGVLNKLNSDYKYTNYDLALRKVELQYKIVSDLESQYNSTLAEAKQIAKDSIAGAIRLDIYEGRKARIDKREKRKAIREDKREVRKKVNSIIWNLENKTNPQERAEAGKYESALKTMEKIKNDNLPKDEQEFINQNTIATEQEKKLEVLHALINEKEAELEVLAKKYDFAENKMDKYKRKDARIDYRKTKKALKETYKSLYGKGWRKEANWNDQKVDLKIIRDDKIDASAGGMRKAIALWKASTFAPIRLAFLGLLALNAFALASRILKVKNGNDKIYQRFRFRWKQLGGNRDELDKLVEKFGKKKPFPPFGKMVDKFSFDATDYYSLTGMEEVVAYVSASSTVLAAVTDMCKAFKNEGGEDIGDEPTGDKGLDDSLKNMTKEQGIEYVNKMNLTDEQKKSAIQFMENGGSLTDALEYIGIDLGSETDEDDEPTESNSNIILYVSIGLAVLLIGGAIVYFAFFRKKGKKK